MYYFMVIIRGEGSGRLPVNGASLIVVLIMIMLMMKIILMIILIMRLLLLLLLLLLIMIILIQLIALIAPLRAHPAFRPLAVRPTRLGSSQRGV